MRHWVLDTPKPLGEISRARAAALLTAIGQSDSRILASEILAVVDSVLPALQCTVFAHESGAQPRVLSVGDRRGGLLLKYVADLYARHFYPFDGNRVVLTEAPGRTSVGDIVLHHQARHEIVHAGYRLACYDQPGVGDRLSLLQRTADGIWLSVNLYKGTGQGAFTEPEIATVQSLAPIVAQAARLHYTLLGQRQQGAPQLMLARIGKHCPGLSKRELDVLRGVLEGGTAAEIAETIGVKPSSVVTYQKRAYRRLGISSQRELFLLAVTPVFA